MRDNLNLFYKFRLFATDVSGYSPELLQTLLESYILNDDNDDGDVVG